MQSLVLMQFITALKFIYASSDRRATDPYITKYRDM